MTSAGDTTPVPEAAPRLRLYDIRFAALLVIIFAGFASNALVQPILPILILDRGGDASTVGLVLAAFSVPSVVLRPLIGRLVDAWSRNWVFFAGTIGCGLANLFYLVPGLGPIFATRIFHGTAWAGFNTGGNATLYELAPTTRRGEAAGVYNLITGSSHMIMPPIGLFLLGAVGFGGPFLLAAAIGTLGGVLILVAPIPRNQPPAPPPTGEGFVRSLIERRALLPMLFELLWTSANSLFYVYPVVFATTRGIPVSELTYYYPIVGIAFLGTRLLVGRHVDKFTRGSMISVGATLGLVALVVAVSAGSVLQLALAGALYASATTFTSPISAALAMDRLDPARRGAAMATYSLGYQLGIGTGAAIWGFVIAFVGFPVPYVLAMLPMVFMLVLVWANRRQLLKA